MKKNLLKYGIPALIGAAITIAVAMGQGLGGVGSAWSLRALSDGCFVTTVLMGGMGALVWVSSTGFFDMFSYGIHSLLVLFTVLRRPEDHVSFYDYKLAKDAKRGKPMHNLLFAGLVLIALSAACLYLYDQLPV